MKNLPKGKYEVSVVSFGGSAAKKTIAWNIRTFADKKLVPLTQTGGKKTKSTESKNKLNH